MASLFALPVQKVEVKSEDDDLKKGVTDFKKRPLLERSKLDTKIAKYLRFNVPQKNTMMQKQPVEYFVGSKAVDALMASEWAVRKKGREQYFVGRDDAAAFLDELLQKRFFYRVMKNEQEKKKKEEKKEEDKESEKQSQIEEKTNLRKRKKTKPDDSENGDKIEEISSIKKKKKKDKGVEEDKKTKEKVKKRYKLTYHEEQVFLDSNDLYIWMYNPVSWKTILKGVGLLLLVAGGTLFPLWPDVVRIGVYYLSVTAGIFIGSVFVVALLRTILFGVIWLFSAGNHRLWLLPNLLEDVGFFESFKPWYSYEYRGSKEKDDDEEKEGSDQEDSGDEEGEEENKLCEEKGDDDDVAAAEEEGNEGDRDSQSEKNTEHDESETAVQ